MKKLETRVLTIYGAIIAWVMAVLGFSCDRVLPGRTEYGTPSAKFILKGKTYSKTTNTAIKGIKVVGKSGNWGADSAITDATGNYQLEIIAFPTSQTFNVQFKDVDGAANGEFSDLDTTVEFKDPKFINGDKHWYSGETSKDFDVKLDPKP